MQGPWDLEVGDCDYRQHSGLNRESTILDSKYGKCHSR